MSKFNTSRVRAAPRKAVTSPIVTDPTASGTTYEGAPGFARDTRSELFLLAVTNMVGEDTFYEARNARDDRFAGLVRNATWEDPEWTAELLAWLRTGANMRSAALVGAAEFAKARLDVGQSGMSRQVIASVLQRADEPGELLAYWMSRYGRAIPKPVKRGVADAVQRLYTEKSLLKYDTASHGFRFADVLDLVHPAPHADKAWQGDLFRYALDRRHERGGEVPASLRIIAANIELRKNATHNPNCLLDADVIARAGMTWEDVLSIAGSGLSKAAIWECLAEGTPVWLPDGRTLPIEQVVEERLPVLSYDRQWDMREPAPGRPYPSRDREVGNLVPAEPRHWIDTGERDVFVVRFASGRELTATSGHRWAVRHRTGSRRPVWRMTSELVPGASVPVSLEAGYFGSLGDELDGWFIGSMLGDGSLTGRTPAWTGQDDGTLDAVREYAAKHGCMVSNPDPMPGCVRVRIIDPVWHQNAVRDELIAHGVWGMRTDVKALADRPYSRPFILGVIAGLIDSDGHVSATSIEFAVISERLARQFTDLLLRVGVLSVLDRKRNGDRAYPLWRVRISDIASVRRLRSIIQLRSPVKAVALDELANCDSVSRRIARGRRGYPDTITWDRIVSIRPAGRARTYCVEVSPSNLWVANGIITGNCMIPSMGYMSQLRNLRNFDEAGVSDEVAATVAARLSDKEQVKASRQLPLRFLSAYRAAPSLRWSYPLEQALYHALSNVPRLGGRTLVLVDTSGSMHAGFSKDGTLMRWDAAVLFGVALAQRCGYADVVSFSTDTKVFPLRKGESVLASLKRWSDGGWFFGGGTNTAHAVKAHYKDHDRVVILTDEQAHYSGAHDVTASVPRTIPVYTWNLAGYRLGHTAGAPNRHTFGGLTDAGFSLISLIEAGVAGNWPWRQAATD